MFQKAAGDQWDKWNQSEAAEPLRARATRSVRNFEVKEDIDYIMSGRWSLTGKNDPLRTYETALPLKTTTKYSAKPR